MPCFKIVIGILLAVSLLFAAAVTLKPVAVAVETVKTVIITDDDEKANTAFLGIYPSAIEDDSREALDWHEDYGILIEDVVEDGPAVKAGLKGGDILIQIDAEKITSLKNLRKVLSNYKPDDVVQVTCCRDGQKFDVKLTLGAGPSKKIEFSMLPKVGKKRGFLGVYTSELSDQLKEYFKVEEGVLIQTVEEETPAAQAGLKAGDIILKIDDDVIDEPDELMETLRSRDPGAEVVVHISRGGKPMDLKVTLGEAPEQVIIRKMLDMDLGEYIQKAIDKAGVELEEREELKEQMEELRKELKTLKQELKNLQEQQQQKQ